MSEDSDKKLAEEFGKMRAQFGGVAERKPDNKELGDIVKALDNTLKIDGAFEGKKQIEAMGAIRLLQTFAVAQMGGPDEKKKTSAAVLGRKLVELTGLLYPSAPPPDMVAMKAKWKAQGPLPQ